MIRTDGGPPIDAAFPDAIALDAITDADPGLDAAIDAGGDAASLDASAADMGGDQNVKGGCGCSSAGSDEGAHSLFFVLIMAIVLHAQTRRSRSALDRARSRIVAG